jgi:diaminopimelate epimerase
MPCQGPVAILRRMRLEKWHGIGNAYLVLHEAHLGDLQLTPARVARICHPDLGAGSDGILLVGAGEHPRVRIFNPDGSEAEFSGNGTRIAVAHLAAAAGRREVTVETLKGPVRGRVDADVVTVDAGRAALESPDHAPDGGPPPAARYTFVSLGNPHCVIEHERLDELDLPRDGAAIERHPWFPNRTNVEYFAVRGPQRIGMRVWERGAGETLSSGSGASAAAVAAVTGGRVASPVTVELAGGELEVDVSDALDVRLTGPVEHVLTGELTRAYVAALEAM